MGTTGHESDALTHCEFCGAEFDQPRSVPVTEPAHVDVSPDDGTPLTHCEFCGIEYPEPATPDKQLP